MTKLNKVTVLLASVAFAGAAFAAPSNVSGDNWRNGHGNQVWKDTSGDCWRDTVWTPATAAEGCGKPVVEAPAPTPAPAPVAKPAVVAEKITLQADAYFDFDKSVLKAEGKAKLDDLASKLGLVNVETLIATGHTDSVGSDAYNDALSLRRANAVKAYLVSKGVESERVLVEGKGERQPVATNATKEGRAQNRRVVVELVGTKK